MSTASRARKSFTLNAVSTLFYSGIFLSIFIPSYFNWNLTEILSNKVKDGWCNPEKEGIGLHCFGDFYAPMGIAGNQDPWRIGVNPNPPFAMLIFKLFYAISNFTTPRFSLILYMLLIFCAFMLPAVHAWRKSIKTYQIKLLYLSMYAMSMPAISLIDRGNIIALTVPLVYFAYLFHNEKPQLTVALLVISVVIKPQLAIFMILLLAVKQYRLFVLAVFSGLTLNLAGFLFFQSPKISISNWIESIFSYPTYAGEGKIYPVNISLQNTLFLMDKSFQTNFAEILITTTASVLVLVYAASILFNLKQLSPDQLFYQIVILLLITGGTVFSYYAVFLSLVFLFLSFFDDRDSIFESPFSSLCSTALLLLIIPISPLSWKLFPFLSNFGQATVAITWTLAQCVLVLLIITISVENFSRKFRVKG